MYCLINTGSALTLLNLGEGRTAKNDPVFSKFPIVMTTNGLVIWGNKGAMFSNQVVSFTLGYRDVWKCKTTGVVLMSVSSVWTRKGENEVCDSLG